MILRFLEVLAFVLVVSCHKGKSDGDEAHLIYTLSADEPIDLPAGTLFHFFRSDFVHDGPYQSTVLESFDVTALPAQFKVAKPDNYQEGTDIYDPFFGGSLVNPQEGFSDLACAFLSSFDYLYVKVSDTTSWVDARGQIYFLLYRIPGRISILHQVKDVDTESDQILSRNHLSDKRSVYFQIDKISEADSKSFRALDEWYGVDQSKAYFGSQAFSAKVENFRTLGDGYATDGETTFYLGSVVE